MDRRKKIVAAISAAISMYLEQEALATYNMYQVPTTPETIYQSNLRSPIISPWSFAGRCSIMERRFNWQYRLCKF